MRGPIESSRREDSPESAALSEPEIAGATAADLIYDLRLGKDCSDGYYADVSRFSDALLTEMEQRANAAIRGYSHYVQTDLGEAARSEGEYAIELLTLGLALTRYAGASEHTPGWVVALARQLLWLRRRSGRMKQAVDRVRGAVTGIFFVPQMGTSVPVGGPSLERLPRLIAWLQATGELEQESMRLRNWQSYLETLSPAEGKRWLETAAELFDWFRREAEASLGMYTRGVAGFLAGERRARAWREDRILRDREPAEYHLGMVAAEIMNRGMRSDFQRAPRRVVLVPTCMRGARASQCRAHVSGLDIVCTGCDPECTVNRITRGMRSLRARVYLIPHATGFSRWLERWQRVPECSVTAVACMLNILPGGYEMRARGIAAQCVPLDYPGCRKHWRREGVSTNLNQNQLVQIVALPRT